MLSETDRIDRGQLIINLGLLVILNIIYCLHFEKGFNGGRFP